MDLSQFTGIMPRLVVSSMCGSVIQTSIHSRCRAGVLHRVTTAGPYVSERLSILVLTSVIVAGIAAVAYADNSVTSLSLASLYSLPLTLSALVHPLRIGIALSFVCLALHDLLSPVRDTGIRQFTRDAATLRGYVFVVIGVNQLGTH